MGNKELELAEDATFSSVVNFLSAVETFVEVMPRVQGVRMLPLTTLSCWRGGSTAV